ncbi:MAG: site-specific integrase [Pseudonocardiaceae bacterium]
MPWLVVDSVGQPVEPVCRFLRDFVAQGNRPGSVRGYVYDLLRWWHWLQVVGMEWDKVTCTEVKDFVLWLRQAVKSRVWARTMSTAEERGADRGGWVRLVGATRRGFVRRVR